VKFDPIPYIDEILIAMFGYKSATPFSPVFNELGYGSQFMFFNLGSQTLILAITPFLVLMTSLYMCFARKFLPNNSRAFHFFKRAKKFRDVLTLNSLIAFTTVNYTLLCVTSMINVYMELGLTNAHKAFTKSFRITISNLLTIITLLWLTGLPLFLIYQVHKHYKPKIHDYKVKVELPPVEVKALSEPSEEEIEEEVKEEVVKPIERTTKLPPFFLADGITPNKDRYKFEIQNPKVEKIMKQNVELENRLNLPKSYMPELKNDKLFGPSRLEKLRAENAELEAKLNPSLKTTPMPISMFGTKSKLDLIRA
jgi:hypothetical protein